MKIKPGQAICLNLSSLDNLISPSADWCWCLRLDQTDLYLRPVRSALRWRCELVHSQLPQGTSLSLCSMSMVNGYPYRFTVKVKRSGACTDYTLLPEDRTSMRALEGGQVVEFLPESGYYNTSFVAMLGPVGSGKTCTICSWRTKLAAENVRHLLPSSLRTDHTCLVQEVLPPSELATVQPSGFKVYNAAGEVTNLLYVVDLSGELTAMNHRLSALGDPHGMALVQPDVSLSSEKRQLLYRIVNLIEEISDALVIVGDDRLFAPQAEIHGDVDAILQLLRQDHCLPSVLCYVCTCADLIREQLRTRPQRMNIGKTVLCPDSPVFDSACAAPNPEEAMYQHICIARELLSQKYALPEHAACFLVSLLAEVEQNGINYLDFGQAVNSELPLVYLLRALCRTNH